MTKADTSTAGTRWPKRSLSGVGAGWWWCTVAVFPQLIKWTPLVAVLRGQRQAQFKVRLVYRVSSGTAMPMDNTAGQYSNKRNEERVRTGEADGLSPR